VGVRGIKDEEHAKMIASVITSVIASSLAHGVCAACCEGHAVEGALGRTLHEDRSAKVGRPVQSGLPPSRDQTRPN